MRLIASSALVALLTGCVGMTADEIKAVDPVVTRSERSPDEIVGCLKDSFGTEAAITTLPSGRTLIDFSRDQFFQSRFYYRIDVIPAKSGATVEARRSGLRGAFVSDEDINRTIKVCS